MRRILHRLCLAALLVPCRAALPSPPTDNELSALLEAMGMGLTRAEMVAEMGRHIQALIDSQEPELAQWFRDTTQPDSLALEAFGTHSERFAAFQAARLDHWRSRFSQDEVRELTGMFRSEPMRRLLAVANAPDSLTLAAGGEFYSVVQAYIDEELTRTAHNLQVLKDLNPMLDE
jgi:hypothetical protein